MIASEQLSIRTKAAYYELAKRRVFGNAFRTWDGVRAWRDSGYEGPIRFRSKVPGSSLFTTGKPHEGDKIFVEYESAIGRGELPNNILFCEPAPEKYLTFQGEICEDDVGQLCLTWSDEPGITNREAMTRPTGRHSGLSAKVICQYFLDQGDYEWLMSLLEAWPGHVVEFSSYSVPVGNFGRRMVVWECRAY